MIRKAEILATTLLLVGLYCQPGLGQGAPAAILEIDVENFVSYRGDVSDLSRLATDPNITTPVLPRNFEEQQLIADIVAINGQPSRGTMLINLRVFNLVTAPNPGQAVADTVRNGTSIQTFEILKPDGTSIGSIFVTGLAIGPRVPGAPLSVTQGNNAIVGGTGAFLGARGQSGAAVTVPARQASQAEDPSNRRRHGGGRVRFVLHVIPLTRPEIAQTLTGPAVAHSSDFALVTASRPAAPGEVLSLFATALGPTRPDVDPGKPFPASPLAVVNSPVELTVNGRPAEVLAEVGLPGAVDGYQVNFRVPPDTARGTATIQVTVAWIAGPGVRIAVQ